PNISAVRPRDLADADVMASKWVSNAAEKSRKIQWPLFGFLSSKVTILWDGRTAAVQFAGEGAQPARRTPLADGVRAGNRRTLAEDGTNFTSYATGSPARLAGCNCCRVVVAGHAD